MPWHTSADGAFLPERMEAQNMRDRHQIIPYALEAVARPGSRETRVRRPPGDMRIRNGRGQGDG